MEGLILDEEAPRLALGFALIEVDMSLLNMKSRTGMLRNASIPALKWDSAKNEVIFGIVQPGGQFQYDFDFTFFIAFGEVDLIAGHPIVPVLADMGGRVLGVLKGCEAEAKRIGLCLMRPPRGPNGPPRYEN
jgi:hypothetical protein